MYTIDPKKTALVAIDLQKGILALNTFPTTSREVVERTAPLVNTLRAAGGLIVYVSVANSPDGGDVLAPATDAPVAVPTRPADWSELDVQLSRGPGDIYIVKRQWGAFFGTELDLQLRRRGIDTIILTGIATHVGVESTARDAFERGYNQVFVSDAIASPSSEAHASSFKYVFPRIGLIRDSQRVAEMIEQGASSSLRAAGEGGS